jgi:hypothetical protein
MDICAQLSLDALIPEQVEISERLIEASQLLLKRLPGWWCIVLELTILQEKVCCGRSDRE